MNIKVPLVLVRAWDKFGDWANVPVWRPIAGLELLRIDLVIAAAFLFCVTWYGYWYGWMGALQGGVMFVVIGWATLTFRK